MFCPRCGSTQSDELRFCKVCGANLYAVRQAVEIAGTPQQPSQNKPWFAEMATSDADSKRRKDDLDHRRGIAAEVKRYNEIKGGVITGSVGIALTIFLYVFMQGLILSGKIPPGTAEILSRIWVAGVIPILIGLSLIINGTVISKRLAKVTKEAAERDLTLHEKDSNQRVLRPADTTAFIEPALSVTDETTRQLQERSRD